MGEKFNINKAQVDTRQFAQDVWGDYFLYLKNHNISIANDKENTFVKYLMELNDISTSKVRKCQTEADIMKLKNRIVQLKSYIK